MDNLNLTHTLTQWDNRLSGGKAMKPPGARNRYPRNTKKVCRICEYLQLKREQEQIVLSNGLPGRIKYYGVLIERKIVMIQDAWSLKTLYPCSNECEDIAWRIRKVKYDTLQSDIEQRKRSVEEARFLRNLIIVKVEERRKIEEITEDVARFYRDELEKASKLITNRLEQLTALQAIAKRYHKPQRIKNIEERRKVEKKKKIKLFKQQYKQIFGVKPKITEATIDWGVKRPESEETKNLKEELFGGTKKEYSESDPLTQSSEYIDPVLGRSVKDLKQTYEQIYGESLSDIQIEQFRQSLNKTEN